MAKQKKVSSECPAHVKINTKGDCVDAGSLEPAEGCCKECVDLVTEAKQSYQVAIATYQTKCKLTPEDAQNGIPPEKICAEECQAMSMEEALMQFDWTEVEQVCSNMPQRTTPLEPIANLLESLQKTWMECRKAPETTTLEPETTTTQLETTAPALRFPPVQIVGQTEWRLFRDSGSISAGLGYEKNELSIAVVPPNIPVNELRSFQYASTGRDVLLNVKHAVFGGTAMKLEVQAEMQYYGSYQGAGQFMKDVRFKVTSSKCDPLHVVTANVKAVEPMSHGSSTNPVASVALILDVEAEGRILFRVQGWKKTLKYIFWGNGNIQSYFM